MLTTRFVGGAPNWLEVGSPDLEGAVDFYRGLFGWGFRSAGPEAGGYGFFQLDGRTVAAGTRTAPDQGPPSWTAYFHSGDAQATAKAVEEAHGTVLTPPVDVLGQGHTAILADRAGVPFGIWQPGQLAGLDVFEVPGSLCWLELYSPDIAAAAGFFNAVLGWETSSVTYPDGIYTCVNPAGAGEGAMFGGLVPLADDPTEAGSDPYWLPYFEVTDTDATVARARELGGTVRMEPMDLPDVGRIAKLADPYGARFAVLKSAPPAPPTG
ncbi:VOC family protein [Streptomyces sp. NPDC057877]|uniref:VOC family protein n=1 Tax=Streptomyces sp. NPDC057877 TaxID=3346269 RepID=UPI0036C91CC5